VGGLSLALLAAAPPAAAQDPGARPGDLAGWIRRQDEQLVGGAADRALAEARDRAAKEPKSAEACFLLGRVLGNTGKLEEAKAQFEAALALDADCSPALRAMAKIHLQRREFETAVCEAQRAWDVDPTPEGRFILVKVLTAKGDRAAAHRLLEEGLKKDPADNDLRFLYSTLLCSEGLYRDAEREVRQVLANVPDHAPAFQVLIEILSNTGRRVDAAAEFKEAIKRDPKNAGLRVFCRDFLVEGKDLAGAADQMEEVLKLDISPEGRVRAKADIAALRAAADRSTGPRGAAEQDDLDEGDVLRRLQSKVVEERRGALELLLQHRLNFIPLAALRCAGDEDDTVRLYAVRLIGKNPDDANVGLLDVVLFHGGKKDPSIAVRVQAVTALGRINSPASLPVLVRALEEPEPEMVRATLAALRDSPAGKSFVDDPGAVGPPDFEAVRARVAKWWFEDPTAGQWRRKAAEAIGRGEARNLGLAAYLIPWVEEEDAGIRAAMLECMALLTKDDAWRSTATGTRQERTAARDRAFAVLAELQKPVKK
jgi:tetratricopeptide (TPR) repeat protein